MIPDDDEPCDFCGGSGDCPWCDGTGLKDGLLISTEPCPMCEGSGTCPECGGSGTA
jgi:hypothetical protein